MPAEETGWEDGERGATSTSLCENPARGRCRRGNLSTGWRDGDKGDVDKLQSWSRLSPFFKVLVLDCEG